MPNDEIYMVVREGLVQRIMVDGLGPEPSLVWPVATTHEDAQRLAEHISHGGERQGVRPALIGTLPHETLEGHIEMAKSEGCVGAVAVYGWNADGSPQWALKLWDEPEWRFPASPDD